MPGKIVLRFELSLQAPVSQVFRAFTNKVGFEEWLCDSASTSPRPGGHVFLNWNTGYATCGRFVEIEPEKRVSFSWRGTEEPAETLVTISLKKQGSGTSLKLVHTGIWEAKNWAKTEQEIKKGWVSGLRNLSAVLESGPDPRITTRPMLGIYLGDSSPDLIKKSGAPVEHGVRLVGVMDGLGAQKCGLRIDDVIVEIEGIAIRTLDDFSRVMPGRTAGEVLNVSFYRGSELKAVVMELSPRKTPPLPASASSLVEEIRAKYAATDQELFTFLESLTEETAALQPAKDQWSVKQILAHLIHGERDVQSIIYKAVVSEGAYFSDNIPARIQATLQAYPTLPDLVSEFGRAEAETLALLAALPDEFTSRKSSFWVLTNLVINFNDHTREHLAQMKKAVGL